MTPNEKLIWSLYSTHLSCIIKITEVTPNQAQLFKSKAVLRLLHGEVLGSHIWLPCQRIQRAQIPMLIIPLQVPMVRRIISMQIYKEALMILEDVIQEMHVAVSGVQQVSRRQIPAVEHVIMEYPVPMCHHD